MYKNYVFTITVEYKLSEISIRGQILLKFDVSVNLVTCNTDTSIIVNNEVYFQIMKADFSNFS